MNKFIVASIFLAFFSCEYVSAGIVELQNDVVHDRHSEIPVVSYTDSTITVSSDSIINNVEVVLKDASGNIVCSDTVDATPCGSSITVPSGIDGGGYAVELYYDEKHLYGYIE